MLPSPVFPDHHDTIVECDNPACGATMRVPWPVPDSPIWDEMDGNTYLRLMIVDNLWYIDLHSDSESLLIGNEQSIADGYSRERLIEIMQRFAIFDDQDYCSMDCVIATAGAADGKG